MMSDSALIQAHQAGDADAIGTLMARYQAILMGMLVNRVGREAEDLYQETWVRASNGLHAYDEQGNFKAWLFQIARRLVIGHHRRRCARVELVHSKEGLTPSTVDTLQPDQLLIAADVHRSFEQALAVLNAPTAEVVRLRLLNNMPFKDIAAHQGVPLNTALGRMHRGLKRIREALIADQLILDERTS